MAERLPLQSSATTLRILTLLMRHFAHGITNKDIAAALSLEPSAVTRHTQLLIDEGYAERIPETLRLRAGMRLAKGAQEILQSLDAASLRMVELRTRITTPTH